MYKQNIYPPLCHLRTTDTKVKYLSLPKTIFLIDFEILMIIKRAYSIPLSNIHVAIYDVGSLTISGSIFTYYSEITPLVSSNSSYLKNNPNCLQNWFIAVSVDLGWWLNTIVITNESTQGLFLCIFVFITSSDFRHSCFIFISSIYLHNWICPILYIVDTKTQHILFMVSAIVAYKPSIHDADHCFREPHPLYIIGKGYVQHIQTV